MPRRTETPEERILRENAEKGKVKVLEMLAPILAKTPEELRDDEKAILRARVTYLSSSDKQTFASALKAPQPEVKKEERPEEKKVEEKPKTEVKK